MRMRHIVICAMPHSTVFSHIISQKAGFSKKKKGYWTQNVCFDFLYKFGLKRFSLLEEVSEIWPKI